MRLQIPPIVPYVVGAMLVIFGALRAKYLGAPRPPKSSDEQEGASTEAKPVRGKEQRRHLAMGAVWIALGLFLVISTAYQVQRR